MASFTAQALIGAAHTFHDGIIPSHYLFLSENDRPAFVLVSQNIIDDEKKSGKKYTWIPSVENMADDMMLMLAFHVLKDPFIVGEIRRITEKVTITWLEEYEGFTGEQRQALYVECRKIEEWPKIVLTVLGGSTLRNQLELLKAYKAEFEVCVANQ